MSGARGDARHSFVQTSVTPTLCSVLASPVPIPKGAMAAYEQLEILSRRHGVHPPTTASIVDALRVDLTREYFASRSPPRTLRDSPSSDAAGTSSSVVSSVDSVSSFSSEPDAALVGVLVDSFLVCNLSMEQIMASQTCPSAGMWYIGLHVAKGGGVRGGPHLSATTVQRSSKVVVSMDPTRCETPRWEPDVVVGAWDDPEVPLAIQAEVNSARGWMHRRTLVYDVARRYNKTLFSRDAPDVVGSAP